MSNQPSAERPSLPAPGAAGVGLQSEVHLNSRVRPPAHIIQVAPHFLPGKSLIPDLLLAASTHGSCSALEFSRPKGCKEKADPTLPKGFTPWDYPGTPQ